MLNSLTAPVLSQHVVHPSTEHSLQVPPGQRFHSLLPIIRLSGIIVGDNLGQCGTVEGSTEPRDAGTNTPYIIRLGNKKIDLLLFVREIRHPRAS